MGKGGVEFCPGGVKNGLKFGGIAPCGGAIPPEDGVLGGGADRDPELGTDSPLLVDNGGAMELGGAEPGEEVLGRESLQSDPFSLLCSSIIPFTLRSSATRRREGSSS